MSAGGLHQVLREQIVHLYYSLLLATLQFCDHVAHTETGFDCKRIFEVLDVQKLVNCLCITLEAAKLFDFIQILEDSWRWNPFGDLT